MKNKKGNVAVIALIILIVAITAGAIGWMFAKKSQAPVQQAAVSQPAVPETQPAVQSAVVDETTGWKTYSSSADGFNFKYPNKIISVSAEQKDTVAQVYTYALKDFGTLYVYKNISKKSGFGYDSLQEFMKSEEARGFISEVRQLGQNTWYCHNQAGLDGTKRYACNLENEKTVYTLDYFIKNDANVTADEFSSIVKSFQIVK